MSETDEQFVKRMAQTHTIASREEFDRLVALTRRVEQAAEIERLRAALREIKQRKDYQLPSAQDIAAAALEGTQ